VDSESTLQSAYVVVLKHEASGANTKNEILLFALWGS
jgi:hypothetical protein